MSHSPKTAESFEDLRRFLAETIEQSKFELSPIRLSDQKEWQVRDGVLSHVSRGFFHICGLKHRDTDEEKLVLYQPQSALTGLAVCRKNGTAYVLLQARIEPGNTGIGQYGPTLQSTPANYLRRHGGRSTPYLDLFTDFSPRARMIDSTMQLDLGKRYFQKIKFHLCVETFELIETTPNMIWAALPAIAESLARDNFLNTDLRSLLAVFNWSHFLHNQEPESSAPESDAFLTQLLTHRRFGAGSWQLSPLASLKSWQLSDQGIEDCSGTGLSVGIYQTSCTSREVRSWSQPLMRSSNQGVVQLLMRRRQSDWEFLLTLGREFGISGEQVVLPSRLFYPEESPAPESGDRVLAEFVQSEEGGRFIQYENIYQLIETTGDPPIDPHQHWVSSHILKKLLNTSNNASLQLRCLSTLVLDKLNPSMSWPGIFSSRTPLTIA